MPSRQEITDQELAARLQREINSLRSRPHNAPGVLTSRASNWLDIKLTVGEHGQRLSERNQNSLYGSRVENKLQNVLTNSTHRVLCENSVRRGTLHDSVSSPPSTSQPAVQHSKNGRVSKPEVRSDYEGRPTKKNSDLEGELSSSEGHLREMFSRQTQDTKSTTLREVKLELQSDVGDTDNDFDSDDNMSNNKKRVKAHLFRANGLPVSKTLTEALKMGQEKKTGSNFPEMDTVALTRRDFLLPVDLITECLSSTEARNQTACSASLQAETLELKRSRGRPPRCKVSKEYSPTLGDGEEHTSHAQAKDVEQPPPGTELRRSRGRPPKVKPSGVESSSHKVSISSSTDEGKCICDSAETGRRPDKCGWCRNQIQLEKDEQLAMKLHRQLNGRIAVEEASQRANQDTDDEEDEEDEDLISISDEDDDEDKKDGSRKPRNVFSNEPLTQGEEDKLLCVMDDMGVYSISKFRKLTDFPEQLLTFHKKKLNKCSEKQQDHHPETQKLSKQSCGTHATSERDAKQVRLLELRKSAKPRQGMMSDAVETEVECQATQVMEDVGEIVKKLDVKVEQKESKQLCLNEGTVKEGQWKYPKEKSLKDYVDQFQKESRKDKGFKSKYAFPPSRSLPSSIFSLSPDIFDVEILHKSFSASDGETLIKKAATESEKGAQDGMPLKRWQSNGKAQSSSSDHGRPRPSKDAAKRSSTILSDSDDDDFLSKVVPAKPANSLKRLRKEPVEPTVATTKKSLKMTTRQGSENPPSTSKGGDDHSKPSTSLQKTKSVNTKPLSTPTTKESTKKTSVALSCSDSHKDSKPVSKAACPANPSETKSKSNVASTKVSVAPSVMSSSLKSTVPAAVDKMTVKESPASLKESALANSANVPCQSLTPPERSPPPKASISSEPSGSSCRSPAQSHRGTEEERQCKSQSQSQSRPASLVVVESLLEPVRRTSSAHSRQSSESDPFVAFKSPATLMDGQDDETTVTSPLVDNVVSATAAAKLPWQDPFESKATTQKERSSVTSVSSQEEKVLQQQVERMSDPSTLGGRRGGGGAVKPDAKVNSKRDHQVVPSSQVAVTQPWVEVQKGHASLEERGGKVVKVLACNPMPATKLCPNRFFDLNEPCEDASESPRVGSPMRADHNSSIWVKPGPSETKRVVSDCRPLKKRLLDAVPVSPADAPPPQPVAPCQAEGFRPFKRSTSPSPGVEKPTLPAKNRTGNRTGRRRPRTEVDSNWGGTLAVGDQEIGALNGGLQMVSKIVKYPPTNRKYMKIEDAATLMGRLAQCAKTSFGKPSQDIKNR